MPESPEASEPIRDFPDCPICGHPTNAAFLAADLEREGMKASPLNYSCSNPSCRWKGRQILEKGRS